MFPFILYGEKATAERYRYHILSGKKHTYYRITYSHPSSLDHEITAIYERFYRSLNPFDRQSTLSKVNHNEITVTDNVFTEAFNRSMRLAKKTNGTFDPTIAPLINYWGFGFEELKDKTIDHMKEYIGYEKVGIVNGRIVKSDPRVQLNFSAMGDGFSCELIARYLDGKGVENYMVDIGGEIITKGKNRVGEDWSVGIIKPPADSGKEESSRFETILHLRGRTSLATSGNYNNYRIENGRKYGHAISALTGMPVKNGILSATVIASDCVAADAYATAIISVEKDNLDELLLTEPSLEYFLICKDESGNCSIKQSEGMRKYR